MSCRPALEGGFPVGSVHGWVWTVKKIEVGTVSGFSDHLGKCTSEEAGAGFPQSYSSHMMAQWLNPAEKKTEE